MKPTVPIEQRDATAPASTASARPAAGARTRLAENAQREPMHWAVAAPFNFDAETDRWLMPFVPSNAHRFSIVPARPRPSWHARRSRSAGIGDWANAWGQGVDAWRASRGGVITVFPHLAFTVGLQQRLRLRNRPVVAWCFNLGALHGVAKRTASRTALAHVDRIVVHSSGEMARYAQWLDLPLERFRFVPLQRASIAIVENEDEQRPFVLAMGSARRDYATLFAAVRRCGHPTLVVAARHALNGLEVPHNVEVRSSLTEEECHRLAQRARVNVVPVLNHETASGQVTLVETMRMGRAVVATRCIGSEDYVESDATGLLVRPSSVDELEQAIERLWNDRALRELLGRNAAVFTAERCSDEAAGVALAQVLDEVRDERGA